MEINVSSLSKFFSDYASRIQNNYSIINRISFEQEQDVNDGESEKKVFEFTQLIVSLFGILIMSFELIKSIKSDQKFKVGRMQDIEKDMEKANEQAYKSLCQLITQLKENKMYYDTYKDDNAEGVVAISFLRRMRNSLAHSGNRGLHFYPIGDAGTKSIKSVIFADDEEGETNSKFYAELNKKQIEQLINSSVLIFSNYPDNGFLTPKSYKDDIVLMKKHMEQTSFVKIQFKKEINNEIGKKFKTAVQNIEKQNKEYSIARVFIQDKNDFFSWVFLNNEKVKILEPDCYIYDYQKLLDNAVKNMKAVDFSID